MQKNDPTFIQISKTIRYISKGLLKRMKAVNESYINAAVFYTPPPRLWKYSSLVIS